MPEPEHNPMPPRRPNAASLWMRFSLRRYLLIGYLFLLVVFWLVNFNATDFGFIFLLLLGVALLTKRAGTFLRDWLPFVLVLVGYEAMRGFADELGRPVHDTDLIAVERALFGVIPTEVLQAAWHPDARNRWFDYLLLFFYFSFFFYSFVVGFVLWLKQRRFFRFFVTGFLMLTFSAYITFILFPAMPPWLAAEVGHLQGVTRLLKVFVANLSGINIPSLYDLVGGNPVAAMPSLHSAWPFYTFLCLVRVFRWKGAPFLIVPVGIWISVVYFGEHYIIDVMAGVLYATGAFLATIVIERWRARRLARQARPAG